MNCIFCKIIKGELPSAKVYENENLISFLDVNPVSRGHCLVVPKKHFENAFDIDDATLQELFLEGKNIAKKLKGKIDADGINFLQSNGKSAGQIVFHFHLHIIPRYENDGLKKHGFFGENTKRTNLEELQKLAEKIRE